MATISPRRNKKGKITSYTIRVYHGYDSNGKRLKAHTMSYKPAPRMTEEESYNEAVRQAEIFEEQCKNGVFNTNSNVKFADFCTVSQAVMLQDEMILELVKQFQKLPFTDKLYVINYINNRLNDIRAEQEQAVSQIEEDTETASALKGE